jgi:undecaprenyl diphosphate synthase
LTEANLKFIFLTRIVIKNRYSTHCEILILFYRAIRKLFLEKFLEDNYMHVGIIMDGNRRYAKSQLKDTFFGHDAGAKTLAKLVEWCPKYGINTLTVYALSTENLIKRDATELNSLFKVIVHATNFYKNKLIDNGIKVQLLGKLENLPQALQQGITDLIEDTKNGNNLVLQLCLNYGGRNEIVNAVNKGIENGEKIFSEEILQKYLDSALEPDLIIRPGGEWRLSNFLTWQCAYSELYFSPKMWPEFKEEDFKLAIDTYNSRNRRYGK